MGIRCCELSVPHTTKWWIKIRKWAWLNNLVVIHSHVHVTNLAHARYSQVYDLVNRADDLVNCPLDLVNRADNLVNHAHNLL